AVVRSVVQAADYKLEESGDVWQVTVPIGPLRRQTVTVSFGKDEKTGDSTVNYRSICGPASEKNAMALLRYNTKIFHGAFAVQKIDGSELVVVQTNALADTLDPLEVSRVLSAIAWQADKVEQKLVGGEDTY
ncbi:MAG: SPFH domain-containing protein, partial [Planctomycetes bacterium]|nr:SPFH domain-containing protein [Planctomycetota bacterium]